MKKLLFFIAFIAAFTAAKAQYSEPFQMKSSTGYDADTLVDANTKYLYYTIGGVQQALKGVLATTSVQVSVVKMTGTVAGTVIVESSLDGAVWNNVYTSYISGGSAIYNLNFGLSDVADQAFRFNLPNWADLYIRVKYVGSGTMTAKIAAKLFVRKELH